MRLCFLYRGKLAAHVDGELGPGWSARVEGHLTGCDRCRTEVAELRRLDQALMVEEPELGGDPEAQRLLARLHEALDRPGFQRSLPPLEAAPSRGWTLPALASGFAMAACLAFFVMPAGDLSRPLSESSNRQSMDLAKVSAPEAKGSAREKAQGAPASTAPATSQLAAAEPGAPLPIDTLSAEMDRLMMRVEKTGSEVLTTVARARERALERSREVASRPVEEDPWSEN